VHFSLFRWVVRFQIAKWEEWQECVRMALLCPSVSTWIYSFFKTGMIFYVFTPLNIKITVLQDVEPCCTVDTHQCSAETRTFMWYLWFPQLRFRSSRMLCCLSHNMLKDHSVYTFMAKESKRNCLHSGTVSHCRSHTSWYATLFMVRWNFQVLISIIHDYIWSTAIIRRRRMLAITLQYCYSFSLFEPHYV